MNGLSVTGGPLGEYYFYRKPILERAAKNDFRFIAVVPVNRAVRQFTRMLIDVSPGKAVMSPPVYTFDSLLLELYRHLPDRRKTADRDVMLLTIADLLKRHRNEWHYFTFPERIPPGFYHRVTDMIIELRRFGFSSVTMDHFADRSPAENSHKIRDIALLQSLMEDRFGPDLIDEPAAINTAAALLSRDMFESVFPDTDTMYISGYGLFTPAMFESVEKLSGWMNIELKLEHLPENPDLFRHTLPAVERLQNYHETGTGTLARYLFNRTSPASSKIHLEKDIRIIACDERRAEIDCICRQIRRLHLEQSVPLNRIGVTFADLESYVPPLRQAFREFDIPANISTGFRLTRSPLVRLFIEVLGIISGGFDTTAVLELLRSPFLQQLSESDLLRLQQVLFERRINRLNKSTLSALQNDLSAPDRRDDPVAAALQTVGIVLEAFFEFPSRATVDAYRSAYLGLLKHCSLLDWYKTGTPWMSERQKENEFRAFNRFMKLYDRVIWTLKHQYGEDTLALNAFAENLTVALRDASYNLTEWPGYGVQVMPRLELQALECDIVILGGLVDGEFPRSSSRDVFFSDETRAQLGLVTSHSLLDQDRFLFYTMLDAKAGTILLTYPRYEGDRALVPSTFVTELEETFGIEKGTDPDPLFLNRHQLEIAFGQSARQPEKPDILNQAEDLLAFSEHDGSSRTDRLNSILGRIAVAAARRSGFEFGRTEGNLTQIPAIAGHLSERFAAHTWSISQLENYATCPMYYFMSRILRVEELPELEETLTHLEKGNLIHRILFEFYSGLKKRGERAYPDTYPEELFSIARRAFDELPFRGFFWEMEKRTYFGNGSEPGLLETFLETDSTYQSDSGFRPAYAEYNFGGGGRKQQDPDSPGRPVTLSRENDSLTLGGKIDRIDLSPDGNLAVHDYKTGRSVSAGMLSQILEGRSFQLPLYLLVLGELLPQYTPVYAGYFQVADADNCKPLAVLADADAVQFLSSRNSALLPSGASGTDKDPETTFRDTLQKALQSALERRDELISGYFGHETDPSAPFCKSFCPYRRMCQKNVAKMTRIRERTERGG